MKFKALKAVIYHGITCRVIDWYTDEVMYQGSVRGVLQDAPEDLNSREVRNVWASADGVLMIAVE